MASLPLFLNAMINADAVSAIVVNTSIANTVTTKVNILTLVFVKSVKELFIFNIGTAVSECTMRIIDNRYVSDVS